MPSLQYAIALFPTASLGMQAPLLTVALSSHSDRNRRWYRHLFTLIFFILLSSISTNEWKQDSKRRPVCITQSPALNFRLQYFPAATCGSANGDYPMETRLFTSLSPPIDWDLPQLWRDEYVWRYAIPDLSLINGKICQRRFISRNYRRSFIPFWRSFHFFIKVYQPLSFLFFHVLHFRLLGLSLVWILFSYE